MIGRWAREDVGDAGDARFARDEKLVFPLYENRAGWGTHSGEAEKWGTFRLSPNSRIPEFVPEFFV